VFVWIDSVFVERLWRSMKYEEVSLKACHSTIAACASPAQHFAFYNTERRHQPLDRCTPDSECYEVVVRLAA